MSQYVSSAQGTPSRRPGSWLPNTDTHSTDHVHKTPVGETLTPQGALGTMGGSFQPEFQGLRGQGSQEARKPANQEMSAISLL